uniref:Uncharacterized protein n=1 Tax=Mycena chlorophos TaxID=658473 RepID=A0ABQ0L9U1_MYCCL|nr:predicted protein [Mycena chlorophos]
MRFPVQLILAFLVWGIAAAPVPATVDARALAADAPLVERAPEFVPDVPKSVVKRSTLRLTVTHGGHAIALTVKSTTSMAKVISAAEVRFVALRSPFASLIEPTG